MEVIHKIEIAAKCPPDNERAKELIQSLSNNLSVTLYSSSNCDSPPESHSILFEDYEKLHNKTRYALILSKDNLYYSTSNIRSIALDWSCVDRKTNGGHLDVELSSNDRGYDHVLTDVRYTDRSLNITPGCYSVCSSINDGASYLDIFITIHTKMV